MLIGGGADPVIALATGMSERLCGEGGACAGPGPCIIEWKGAGGIGAALGLWSACGPVTERSSGGGAPRGTGGGAGRAWERGGSDGPSRGDDDGEAGGATWTGTGTGCGANAVGVLFFKNDRAELLPGGDDDEGDDGSGLAPTIVFSSPSSS